MFEEEDREQLISSSVWIGLLLFEMFALCYVCHNTKIEVIYQIYNLCYSTKQLRMKMENYLPE